MNQWRSQEFATGFYFIQVADFQGCRSRTGLNNRNKVHQILYFPDRLHTLNAPSMSTPGTPVF